LAALAHSCNRGGYRCIGPEPGFVNAVTGAARRSDDYCAVVQRFAQRQIQRSIGRAIMLSKNRQLVAEVMTVIVLGSATFFAMSSERPIDNARQSGMIAVTALNSPELPQELVRDYTFGP
jgi:hypothetical protein